MSSVTTKVPRNSKDIKKEVEKEITATLEEAVGTSTETREEEKSVEQILEEWPQFQEISGEGFAEADWKCRIKEKDGGKHRYITVRHQYRGDDGKWNYAERGLGAWTQERWDAIKTVFPEKPIKKLRERRKTNPLASRIARVKPLSSVIHFDTSTLQWYQWSQEELGYPGPFEEWINEVVHILFRKHFGYELAIVRAKEN